MWLRLGATASLTGGALHAATVCDADKKFKTIKVVYGDMPFWRAECLRVALFVGGVPFEDVRDKPSIAEYRARGDLTFGALPVLDVDGKILTQTQAMATFAAKLARLHPADVWHAAKVDEVR